MPVKTEMALIRRARRGDSGAFQILYELYRNFVYQRCFRLTRDSRLAEDLTQDVFVQVWKKMALFRGDSAFKTWLYRITSNTVYMHFRRMQRRSEPQLCELHPAEDAPIEELVPSSPAHLDEHLLVCQIISILTPSQRAVLILHDVQGYKHEEIAKVLGVPSGTSKSKLHRARLQLRKMFTPRILGKVVFVNRMRGTRRQQAA